jgi:integrase
MKAAAVRASRPEAPAWQWPIHITDYDRRGRLSAQERRSLKQDLPRLYVKGHSATWALNKLEGIERLRAPLDDALAALETDREYDDAVKLMILEHCATRGVSFWAWDAATWCRIFGDCQAVFETIHRIGYTRNSERPTLVATAYVLRCFTDIAALQRIKRVQRVRLACRVFGTAGVMESVNRVFDVWSGWGYRRQAKALTNPVAELLLISQRPELEALTDEVFQAAVNSMPSNYGRRTMYFQISRVLAHLGILSYTPRVRIGTHYEISREARTAGVAPDWVAVVERWEKTTTMSWSSIRGIRNGMLRAGRWLSRVHPEITKPEQWTRELAAEYVAALCKMKIGDYACRTETITNKRGQPITPRAHSGRLGQMSRFFADLQEWEWIPRRFKPYRAFAVPRSVRVLIGPEPRTIADDLWAKLLWAGLNLTREDLPVHGGSGIPHPETAVGYYPLEMLQALSVVWLFAGLRSDEIRRLRVGCVHQQPALQEPAPGTAWLLDVPVHKTGTAMTKPVDPIVGEAITAWERVRPVQPKALDHKTEERVDFLFSVRNRCISKIYINLGLIPILCRKAGVPRSDARGSISSHRARSTIASQLYNARDPMTLHELQVWLGHRSASSTLSYVRFAPTRLARAYTEAQYFQRNLRMMDVLVDQQAIQDKATDKPWRYYDLGHGLCSYEFFDQCPHRMACARCDFYIPKESSQADLVASKAGMVHMLQEIPLTDDERAAVEGDKDAIDRLLKRLATTPVPSKAKCSNCKKC